MATDPSELTDTAAEAVQAQFNDYVGQYPVELAWPPHVSSGATNDPTAKPRTNVDLIYHRLLESGVMPGLDVPLQDALFHANQFVADLQRTGCFESVQVTIGDQASPSSQKATTASTSSNSQQQPIHVILKEKNWYRLHAGGAIKADEFLQHSSSGSTGGGLLPTAELEISAGLRNLTGHLDTSSFGYTLDTNQLAHWFIRHERPFYSILPAESDFQNALLLLNNGSQWTVSSQAYLQTINHEWTRSYHEYQRGFQATLSNHHNIPSPERAPGAYWGITYQALLRDVIPTGLHISTPLVLAAAATPQLKHAIQVEFRQNGVELDNAQLPTRGGDFHLQAEYALPVWSDVTFTKVQARYALHKAVDPNLSLHGIVSLGCLWGPQHGLSDRFYVGGPLNFRGFLPAGVGPRASKAPSTALGGDFYYTATAMASLPLNDDEGSEIGEESPLPPLRAFCFATVGTCVGQIQKTPLSAILPSSRASVGLGIATNVLGSRLEFTYSVPLRYGPMDHRRTVQLGMAVHLDQ